jgi:GNAT superfamily N-acetyltransferase
VPTVYRQATVADIAALWEVRISVGENVLADPSKITSEVVADYLQRRGRGWVCERDGVVVGFSVADAETASIWALFLRPEAEGLGIATNLLRLAVDWLFAGGAASLTLSTTPGTRADRFYARRGWRRAGTNAEGEVVFELRRAHEASGG